MCAVDDCVYKHMNIAQEICFHNLLYLQANGDVLYETEKKHHIWRFLPMKVFSTLRQLKSNSLQYKLTQTTV